MGARRRGRLPGQGRRHRPSNGCAGWASRRAAQPDVHHGARVWLDVAQPKECCLVVAGMHEALDQCGKIQRDDVYLDAQSGKVLLNESGHALPCTVSRVGKEGKLYRMAFAIEELVAAPPKAVFREEA